MTRDIIFVTHHLGGIGGVQRVVDQLATRFAEDGNKVTVVGCAVQSQEKYEKVQKNYHEILLYQEDIFFEKPWLFLKEKYYSKKIRKRINCTFVTIKESNGHFSKPNCLSFDGKKFEEIF